MLLFTELTHTLITLCHISWYLLQLAVFLKDKFSALCELHSDDGCSGYSKVGSQAHMSTPATVIVYFLSYKRYYFLWPMFNKMFNVYLQWLVVNTC